MIFNRQHRRESKARELDNLSLSRCRRITTIRHLALRCHLEADQFVLREEGSEHLIGKFNTARACKKHISRHYAQILTYWLNNCT